MRNKAFGCYLDRIRELPSGAAMKKALMKPIAIAVLKLENVRTRLSPAHILNEQLLESFDRFTDFQLALDHIRSKQPRFFINSALEAELASLIQREFSQLKDQIIAETDKICSHIFDFLGSGDVNLDEFVEKNGGRERCGYFPWHFDFKDGYRWNPKKYYKEIKIPYGKADIKVPWELSRFQYLSTLGEAYWLSNDEKYAKEFVNQISDWLDNNKPMLGVNWRCTMDVAIRACNWILGFYFFRDSKEITDEFLIKFLKSLLIHGKHIERNLEKSWRGLTSNHYLSDIVGLIYLGIFFKGTKKAERWLNLSIQELKKEMKKQVYPDGVDFEASASYHRLVLELFFYATFLVIINNKNFKENNFIGVGNEIFGEKYVQRLYEMFEFVLYVLKPNGRMPQIGDNDNGRLHIFTKREVLDMRYLLTLGTIFFKEPKFKIKEFGFCEEALWIFGKKGYKIWQSLEENCLANIGSRTFPDAGWYIMRSDKNYMFVSCGPNGQNGNGGHCHNDKLSFELCIDGKDIIVDPGTYIYAADPEWRNRFRSTAYHNTVVLDGQEQNRFDKKSLFEMRNDTVAKCLRWEINDEMDIFIGEHYGYKRFSQPVIHKREIKFHKKEGKLEIIDRFRGDGEHSLEWNLVLSPEFRRNLNISSDELQWFRDPTFCSSGYGIITKTEKLTSTLKTKIPVEVKFWIEI